MYSRTSLQKCWSVSYRFKKGNIQLIDPVKKVRITQNRRRWFRLIVKCEWF